MCCLSQEFRREGEQEVELKLFSMPVSYKVKAGKEQQMS